ncbi:206_t:CDS:2, partial [Scutellospora calospora]
MCCGSYMGCTTSYCSGKGRCTLENAKKIALSRGEYPTGLHLDIYYPEYGQNMVLQLRYKDNCMKKYVEFFHRGPNNFIQQQRRDQLKKEL